ncbi:hypothetical protein O7622_08785 [Micromonospora sp. WMMD1076]|uniref:hypothetical protein n=1 Tax=Micromonospora TaxID=1873 RepID=UPI00249A45D1|nr:hypothetical protein [Micromonospora sp. WMMD1076]WFF08625.1 hypothetical protein O7622_08785 [Micromonospora sp. WMMD1076]
MSDSTPARRTAGRSPSFPAINLETAVRRARELYERERQHPTPIQKIVAHWGYKGMTGPANLSVAALKKFGLLTDEGKGAERRGRLTHLAVDIIANPNQSARNAAIKQAALMPSAHRELWDRYGNELPSDANLRWELVRQRGFTEGGAEDLIRGYKQTVAFAQLEASDRASRVDTDDTRGESDHETKSELHEPDLLMTSSQASDVRPSSSASRFPIPVFNGAKVVIEGDFPLSEEDWNQFMAVLSAMKPALVDRAKSPS